MSVYDNLLKYFNRSVRPYLPYKNNKVYQSLCSVLRDYFFKDSYLNIPQNLSTYVEQQKINISLYSNLLIGNGYPNSLVLGWSTSQKEIILNKLMHYQNEAGTLRHYIDICDAFQENFDVFELYADTRILVDEVKNVPVKKWIMIANPIYLSSKLPKLYYDADNERIYDYDEIYNGTPTYFISSRQLNYWYYFAKALVLPFKTNLIILIWKNETQFTILDSIMASTTYSYYQHEHVTISFNNQAYMLKLADAYQVWHYLLLYASGDDEKTFDSTIKNVIFGISNNPIYTLTPGLNNSIDTIIEAYNNIIDKESYDNFINNYYSKFTSYINNGANTTETIRKKLLLRIPSDLVAYLEYLIDSGTSKLLGLYNALSIIETAIDSFIEDSDDVLLSKYSKWLKILLTKPTINIKQTITYQLLLQFKPYHTRFIERIKIKVVSNDRTNNCFIKDIIYFVVHLWQSSGLIISDLATFIKNIYGSFYLVNGKNTISGNCLLFNLKVGNVITFSSINLGIADFDCYNVQVVEITHTNPIITNDQYLDMKSRLEFKNTAVEQYFNSLSTLITNVDFDTVVKNLTVEFEWNTKQYVFIKQVINDLMINIDINPPPIQSSGESGGTGSSGETGGSGGTGENETSGGSGETGGTGGIGTGSTGGTGDTGGSGGTGEIIVPNFKDLVPKNEFHQALTDYFNINEIIINYLNQQLLPKLETLNVDNVDYYEYEPLLNIIDELSLIFEINSEHKNIIKHILYKNVVCTIYFDTNWKYPTGYYNKLIITELPPINETIGGGLWTFSNLNVICNEEAFKLIYIGDTIFVPDDGLGYGVKVIGKDLNTLNLILNTSYTGTAGTFSVIGRYRSGF